MSATLREVANRLLRTVLTPPDYQYAQVRLGAPVTSETVESIMLGAFTISEDENLLRQGSLLELGEELVRVVEYDTVTKTVTVTRGEYSTPTSTYDTPMLINLNPSYPMQSVFEALRDNVTTLYPRLWTVRSDALTAVSGSVFAVPDPLTVAIVETYPNEGSSRVDVDARVVDFHPLAGGRAILTNVPVSNMWVRYRRRMAVATSLDDTLDELGVEDVWAQVVMFGAAADLMAGRDVSAAQTEWVGQVLQAENIRVGTRLSISGGLAQYRDILIDRFSKEMKAEESNQVKVHMNDPFTQVG